MDYSAGQVTPTQGAMSAEEHNAFLLRILMHLVSTSDGSQINVSLHDVLESTKDRTMMVSLNGDIFTAQVMQIPAMRN